MTVFDPFVAFGQLLPAGAFVQAHAGADLPVDFDTANPEIFWRAALGWSLVAAAASAACTRRWWRCWARASSARATPP